jgi:hypothetical protein
MINSTAFDSILDNELKFSLDKLKQELEQTRMDKDRLQIELNVKREEVKLKDQEIEYLKKSKSFKDQIEATKTGLLNSSASGDFAEKDELMNELRKIKMDLFEKEGNLDILNLKIEELTKLNKNLNTENQSLKDQVQKRREKVESEMSGLYTQIKELELKKLDLERNNTKEQPNIRDSHEQDQKAVEIKMENKQLSKKLEDIKGKYERDISLFKHDSFDKENKIKQLEISLLKSEKEFKEKSDSLTLIKAEYEIVKQEIEGMKMRVDLVNKNSTDCEGELFKMKVEFENNVKKKENEVKELKANLEMNTQLVERSKKMEKALKTELANKDEELNSRQEIINDIRAENDRLQDEILTLKKETFNLQSRMEIIDTDYKSRSDMKGNDYKLLKERERKYEKALAEMKEILRKKQKVLDNKKKMNLLLVDLARVKKGEVQCIEHLQYSSSVSVEETLKKLKEQEKDILSRYIIFLL